MSLGTMALTAWWMHASSKPSSPEPEAGKQEASVGFAQVGVYSLVGGVVAGQQDLLLWCSMQISLC